MSDTFNPSENLSLDDAQDIANRLELKFEAQNLRFSVPFMGYAPVQAFGWISGLRFYYRARGSYVSLIVGAFSEVLEQRLHAGRLKRQRDRNALLAHKLEIGEQLHLLDYLNEDATVVTGQEDNFYPSVILFKSGYSEDSEITVENGFIYLVDNLKGISLTPKDLGY